MNPVYELVQRYALSFALIVSRVSGMILIAPMFAGFSLPIEVLVVATVALSYMCLPLLGTGVPTELPLVQLAASVLFNLFIGFFIGLLAYTLVSAVYVGSEIFGVQSGFNVSGSFDPTVEESPLTSELVYIMSLFIFVSLKGHTLVLSAVVRSTEVFPLVVTQLPFDRLGNFFLRVFLDAFGFSLQLAMPLIGLMFVINVLFGILSRLVPQMNVFMVALPASTMILFLLMVVMIPAWTEVIAQLIQRIEPYIEHLLSR